MKFCSTQAKIVGIIEEVVVVEEDVVVVVVVEEEEEGLDGDGAVGEGVAVAVVEEGVDGDGVVEVVDGGNGGVEGKQDMAKGNKE